MDEIVKHINDTNASYRQLSAGDAKNTDLFLDNEHYALFKDSGEQITVRYNKENLSKAILFIASILPRKFDQSSIHCTISYSKNFVTDQLALLDALFKENGISVETITQVWNARKDVPQKNGNVDSRFYFNGLIKDVAYTDHSGMLCNSKFTIRNYLAGGYSDLHIKKATDGIFDVTVTNVTTPYDDGKENGLEDTSITTYGLPLQQIFYGAPGTGKSHTIKDCTKGKDVIRTTFHPDSDYSTFVGAYKPTTKEVKLRDVSGHVVLENGKEVVEDKIVYEFVEQAFLQAYVKAWTKYAEAQDGEQPKEQYLIIEEINRGNCAQIFGDLFQLLDRNDAGFSDYPIKADNDMTKHLKKALGKLEIKAKDSINGLYTEEYDDVVSDVLEGKVLLLPNNLFIWATMNTSDQSLFPIDSAFKRRWEWKYIPISNAAKGWVIEANGNRYGWWAFLEKINSVVCDTTSSEDKKLGYFFAKADGNGVISADKFIGKVAFYLWNDVFKDYGFENDIFKGDNGESIAFQEFFLADGKANEVMVEKFLRNLGLIASAISSNDDGEDDEEDIDGISGKDQTKYSINGEGRYAKKNIATELIKKYCSVHTEMTAKEVVAEWKPLSYLVNHFIETQEEFDRRQDKKDRMAVIVHNGDNIYVSTNGWGGKSKMEELKDALSKKDWGLQISEVTDGNN